MLAANSKPDTGFEQESQCVPVRRKVQVSGSCQLRTDTQASGTVLLGPSPQCPAAAAGAWHTRPMTAACCGSLLTGWGSSSNEAAGMAWSKLPSAL